MVRTHRTMLIAAGTLAALAAVQPADARDPVGVFGAAQPRVIATFEDSRRRIQTGSQVLFRDRVQTGPDGRAEIMFQDESRLSIGPDANIRITEAIYTPGDQDGSLALEATSGAMRFIGGALSKQDGQVKVDTPLATLAIRGAIVTMNVSGQGLDVVMSHGDEVRITNRAGEERRLTRNGYGITIGADGGFVGGPRRFSPSEIKDLMAQLQTRATGGAQPGQLPGEAIDTETQDGDAGAASGDDTYAAQQAADEALEDLLSNLRRLNGQLAPIRGSGRVDVGERTGGDSTRRRTIRRQLR